jgi:hypothetical protein
MNEPYPSSDARPLTLDELAALPDVPASAEMPQEIAKEFAQKRVYISGVEEEPTGAGRLRRVEDGAGEWELRLPAGAVVGRPGRDTEVFEPPEPDPKNQDSTDAFRPEWIPQSYHPRLANEFTLRPALRRVDGTPVQPLFVFHPTTGRSTTRTPTLSTASGACSRGRTLPPTRRRTVGERLRSSGPATSSLPSMCAHQQPHRTGLCCSSRPTGTVRRCTAWEPGRSCRTSCF